MVKYNGKVYDAVIEILKERGISTEGIGVKGVRGNGYHWIVKDDRVVGEFNHKSKECTLEYKNNT